MRAGSKGAHSTSSHNIARVPFLTTLCSFTRRGGGTDGDGDAYGFLDISKDRKETIKEVEEPVKKVVVSQTKRGEFADTASAPDLVEAELFGFQRWISGCPEGRSPSPIIIHRRRAETTRRSTVHPGNEQQQLFSLYTDLSGEAFVPAKCVRGHPCIWSACNALLVDMSL